MGCCASEQAGGQNERLEKVGAVEKKENKPLEMAKPMVTSTAPPVDDKKKKWAKNPKIKLGYWKIRGLAQPIRYLLEYIEHPYEDVHYEQGDAPEFSIESWTSVKNDLGLHFPNMPYMIDGATTLTDTVAIMIYLAAKYEPELLGKTPAIKARVDMLYT
jgi:hypothetical protein